MRPTQKDHVVARWIHYATWWAAHAYRLWWMLKARMLRRGFRCIALEGRSHANISINSDMTVSCNCQAKNAAGYLGNLRAQSFKEIFSGAIAESFRDKLVRGVLPINYCTHCADLRWTSRQDAVIARAKWDWPKHLMVENTAICKLACTSCSRTILKRSRQRQWLSPGDIKTVASTFRELGVKSCIYTKLGEPFMSNRIESEIDTLLEANPDLEIFCSTSGADLNSESKRNAALKMKWVLFSIDGINTEQCNRYQKGQEFEAATQAMFELVRERNRRGQIFPIIIWKWVVFRWNDRECDMRAGQRMCLSEGVDYMLFCPAISPPLSWSWRFWFNSPFHQQPFWVDFFYGYLISMANRLEHDQYIHSWKP